MAEYKTLSGDVFDELPTGSLSNSNNDPTADQVQALLAGFTVFNTPFDDAYLSQTTKIPITAPQCVQVASITDGIETVTFDESMQRRSVPGDPACFWCAWGSPPQAEDAHPDVLFSNLENTRTLTLSRPARIFGLELETNIIGINETYTVQFFSGNVLVGTITRILNNTVGCVDGQGGSRLFAAQTDGAGFDKIVITGTDPFGFSIAQIRYAIELHDICVPDVLYGATRTVSREIDVNNTCGPVCRSGGTRDFTDITCDDVLLCCLTAVPDANCTCINIRADLDIVFRVPAPTGDQFIVINRTFTDQVCSVGPFTPDNTNPAASNFDTTNIPVGNIIDQIDGACVTITDLSCSTNPTTGVTTITFTYTLKLYKHNNLIIEAVVPNYARGVGGFNTITVDSPFNEFGPCEIDDSMT